MSWTSREGKTRSQVFLTWRDVRQLLEPNLSLAMLGQRYGLNESQGKGLFPHSWSDSIYKLKTTKTLPPADSSAWYSSLSGKRPSLEDIQKAGEEYINGGFQNCYEYLCHYLQVKTKKQKRKRWGENIFTYFYTLEGCLCP